MFFTKTSSQGGPRVGLLLNKTPTPTILRPTVSCGPRFMLQPERPSLKRSRDTSTSKTIKSTSSSTKTPPEIVSLDLASVSTLDTKALHATTTTSNDSRVIAHYLNHSSRIVLFTSRNLHLADEASTNKKGLTINTSKGYKYMNGKDYATIINQCKPDIACALSSTTFCGAGSKRVRKSVETTIKYLDELTSTLILKAANASNASSASSASTLSTTSTTSTTTSSTTTSSIPSSSSPYIFAAIVGGVELPRERQRCIEEIMKRSSKSSSIISGYVLAGFSNGESKIQREQVVAETITHLPTDAPRMLECVSDVLGVLDAIALGIDLISWSYPDALTDACCAATLFSIDTNTKNKESTFGNATSSKNATSKICLRDATYARDTRPLVEGCQCYACRHHTRAYIHHLVVVHEILGQALLDAHNWYHGYEWLATIRSTISNNTFDAYNSTFRNNYK
jgi:queuine tRNA-ribosyltransferase subunit QTRTD1